MFLINIRFQLAAFCFLIIIYFSYVSMKKLSLLSTRWFNMVLAMSGVYMIFDFVTVYTVTHVATVPIWLNDLCHRIFVFSLVVVMLAIFFYIQAIGREQKRLPKMQKIIFLTPFCIAVLIVIFGDIKYYCEEDGAYSYGLMPSAVYLIAGSYIIAVLISAAKFHRTFHKRRLINIGAGVSIWILASLIQLTHPTLLLSGLGVVLMVFLFYLSFQNPKELQHPDTGVFNERALGYSLKEHIEAGKPFFIIGIYIKDMATLQNLLGKKSGNQMIMELVQDLKANTKTPIYYSDDSFKLILPSEEAVEGLIQKIQRCFYREHIVNNTKLIQTTASYILECPKYASSVEHIVELDNFLMKSLLPTTQDGQIITVDENILREERRKALVSSMLFDALQSNGLEVYYQPIYDLKTGRFRSAEALVRLKNTGELGFISPEEFIPMAERNGLIGQLGEVVFRKVCKFAQDRKLIARGIEYIEVNLSGVQIVDENICSQLEDIMKCYDTEPSFINLEITETAAVEYKDMLQKNMNSLRKMGCSFSMDDFGTGYSNIAQIAHVHYDLIKLDKSLLWACYQDDEKEKARMVLESIIELIHKMGVKIVQEGVETEEQFKMLKSLGVEYMQGYYFSRPVNEVEYIRFLVEEPPLR